MQVTINGENRELTDGTSVAELLSELGLRPNIVAVECNQELVPRAQHGEHILRPGDQLEIVTLVGGG